MSNLTEKFNTLWTSVMDVSRNQANALANAANAADSTELANANANLESKTTELATAQSNLESKTSELATQTSLVASTQASLNALTAENKKHTKELATAKNDLAIAKMKDDDISKHYHFDSIRIQRHDVDKGKRIPIPGQSNLDKKFLLNGIYVITEELKDGKWNNRTYRRADEINSYKYKVIPAFLGLPEQIIEADPTSHPTQPRDNWNDLKPVGTTPIDADTLEFKYASPINYNNLIGIDLANNLRDGNIGPGGAKYFKNGKRVANHPMKWICGCTIQLLNGTNVVYETRIIDHTASPATNYPFYPSAISTPNKLTYNGLNDYARYTAFLIAGPKYKGSWLENTVNRRNNLGGRQNTYMQNTQLLFLMKNQMARVDREHMRAHLYIENSRKNKALSDLRKEKEALATAKADDVADDAALAKLKGEVATKTTELATAQSNLDSKTTELATAEANLAKEKSDLLLLFGAYGKEQTKSKNAQKALDTANAELAAANEALATAKADDVADDAELAKLRDEVSSKTSELATAQSNLATKTTELATAQSNLDSKISELSTAEANLAKEKSDLLLLFGAYGKEQTKSKNAQKALDTANAELAAANELLPRITASYANDTGKLTVNYRNVKSSKHFWGIYKNNDNPFTGSNGKYKGWGEITKKPTWGYLNGTHVSPTGDFETTGSYTLHHPNLAIGSYKVVLWNNVGTPNNENYNIMHGQTPNVATFTKSSQPTASVPAGIPAGFREVFTDSKFVEKVNTTSDGKIYVQISLHDGQMESADYTGFLDAQWTPAKGVPFDKFAQKIKEHGGRTINNMGDLYDEMATGKWAMRFNNKSYHIDKEGEINDYQASRAKKSDYLILKCKGTYTNDWYLESSSTRAFDITWYTSHQ